MSLLLAADTSGKNGSLALARIPSPDTSLVQVVEVVPLAGGTFSAQLVPQIADLLARHNFSKEDISAFTVASGPGSFTGLRVGLAAIKALAEVLQKPIAAVSLLEAIATCSLKEGRVMAALEAGRGDVYVGEYERRSDEAALVSERLLTRQEFVDRAKSVLVVTPDSTLAELARRSSGTAEQVAYPDAGFLAHIGWRKIQSGQTVSPADLEANYIRRSDAEIFSKPS